MKLTSLYNGSLKDPEPNNDVKWGFTIIPGQLTFIKHLLRPRLFNQLTGCPLGLEMSIRVLDLPGFPQLGVKKPNTAHVLWQQSSLQHIMKEWNFFKG